MVLSDASSSHKSTMYLSVIADPDKIYAEDAAYEDEETSAFEEEVDEVFKWDEGDSACTREFNTIYSYFLSDEITKIGMTDKIPGSEPKEPDDCCNKSEGDTNSELIMACERTSE